MDAIRPGTRVYVIDDDCDEHIEVRITPGIVRKVIVETEADTDGGVSDLVSYEIEPEGSPKARMRRLFCDVIEHERTDVETRLAIGRAVLLRIARMRPACPRCGVAIVGRHECEALDHPPALAAVADEFVRVSVDPGTPTPVTDTVLAAPGVEIAPSVSWLCGADAFRTGKPRSAPEGADVEQFHAGWDHAEADAIPF